MISQRNSCYDFLQCVMTEVVVSALFVIEKVPQKIEWFIFFIPIDQDRRTKAEMLFLWINKNVLLSES